MNEFKEKLMLKIELLEKQGQLDLFMIERAIDDCLKEDEETEENESDDDNEDDDTDDEE